QHPRRGEPGRLRARGAGGCGHQALQAVGRGAPPSRAHHPPPVRTWDPRAVPAGRLTEAGRRLRHRLTPLGAAPAPAVPLGISNCTLPYNFVENWNEPRKEMERMSIGLLVLRVVVGLLLVGHGTQKLFSWFGGGGLDVTARSVEPLGFEPGHVVSGSFALLLGLVVGIIVFASRRPQQEKAINPTSTKQLRAD